jgi:hypothetical protein
LTDCQRLEEAARNLARILRKVEDALAPVLIAAAAYEIEYFGPKWTEALNEVEEILGEP